MYTQYGSALNTPSPSPFPLTLRLAVIADELRRTRVTAVHSHYKILIQLLITTITGARLAGGARTAHSVSRILDALTARATVRGSATADPAGAVCFAIKVMRKRDYEREKKKNSSVYQYLFSSRTEILRNEQHHVSKRCHLCESARRRRKLSMSVCWRIYRKELRSGQKKSKR